MSFHFIVSLTRTPSGSSYALSPMFIRCVTQAYELSTLTGMNAAAGFPDLSQIIPPPLLRQLVSQPTRLHGLFRHVLVPTASPDFMPRDPLRGNPSAYNSGTQGYRGPTFYKSSKWPPSLPPVLHGRSQAHAGSECDGRAACLKVSSCRLLMHARRSTTFPSCATAAQSAHGEIA